MGVLIEGLALFVVHLRFEREPHQLPKSTVYYVQHIHIQNTILPSTGTLHKPSLPSNHLLTTSSQ